MGVAACQRDWPRRNCGCILFKAPGLRLHRLARWRELPLGVAILDLEAVRYGWKFS